MIVVFLGPPGAGKGTQAKLLEERDGFHLFSTGDIIRDEIARETPLGLEMKEYVERGELVPDRYLFKIVEDFLKDKKGKVIFDGFPRNLSQDDMFRRILNDLTYPDFFSILIDVREEVLIKRLLARMRKDDTEEIIKRRLEVYRAETYPLVERYRREGRLRVIDGDRSIEEVYSSIKGILNDYNKI